MKNIWEYTHILSKCQLFANLTPSNIQNILTHISALIRVCNSKEIIINQEEPVDKLYIVLEGVITAERLYASGDISIIAQHKEGSVFGEILVCNAEQMSPVCVTASKGSVILQIEYSSIFSNNALNLQSYATFLKNMLHIMSLQYFNLEKKIRYLSIKSIRERISEFLNDCKSNSDNQYIFSIPFDREGMAHYLNINRSALSRELSRMKNEGIIDFNKNQFRIL